MSVTDTFPTAGSLSANWQNIPGQTAISILTASNAGLATTGQGLAIWVGSSFSNDQYAEITVGTAPNSSSNGIGPIVRMDGSGNGYVVGWSGSGLPIYVTSFVAGAYSATLFYVTTTINPGDRIGIGIVGSTLTLYLNGVIIASGSDSTYMSGSPGMYDSQGTSTSTNQPTISKFYASNVFFDFGFDFRNSSGFVTDPANCFYVGGYPAYDHPISFGSPPGDAGYTFTAGLTGPSDGLNTNDARLAGSFYNANGFSSFTQFQIDLPAPGKYSIEIAMGSPTGGGWSQYLTLLDGVSGTAFQTLTNVSVAAANSFMDASGNVWTEANFFANQVPVVHTFTNTALVVEIGNTGGSGYSSLAHIRVTAVGSGTTYTQSLSAATAAFAAAVPKQVNASGILGASSAVFAGAAIKKCGKSLSAACASMAAAISKQVSKSLAAATSSFAGSPQRQTGHAVAAAMSSLSGAVGKQTSKALKAASSTWSGVAAGIHVVIMSFSAAMATFGAAVSKQINKNETAATASFSTAMARKISRELTATAAAFSGSTRKQTARCFAAVQAGFSGSASAITNVVTLAVTWLKALLGISTPGLTATAISSSPAMIAVSTSAIAPMVAAAVSVIYGAING